MTLRRSKDCVQEVAEFDYELGVDDDDSCLSLLIVIENEVLFVLLGGLRNE